jgi:hypothetical protein
VIINRALIAIISIFLFAWSGILGCGTRSQVRVHEEEKEPELEMVQAVRQEAVAAVPYITLEWDASSGPDIAGYKIYYGTSSRNYDTVIDIGNYTSVSIADLEDNETYYFAVTAYNADGDESVYSSEVCINCGQDKYSIYPVHGTIGTEIMISGQDCGETKGKVLIGELKCKVLEWTDTSVRCLIKKVPSTMGPGTYHVMIVPKGKGVEPIVLEDAFSIMPPNVQAVATHWNSATITGLFFGTKKVKAYLVVDENGKRKKMKILSLEMDFGTGFSRLDVIVSNKVMKELESGTYDVIVTNKVGSDTFPNGFTKE